jgi:hypothetical protein
VGARIVYSAFILFSVAGLVSAALLHGDGMGIDGATAAAWWRGDEASMTYPKSYRQLLELTHFHLFTEPVTFLVLAHLYNLGGDAPRTRAVVTVATLCAMAAQIALPWGVVYVAAGLGAAMAPVSAVLLGGFLYMAAASMWECWSG